MEVLLGPLLPYILGFLAVVGALFVGIFKGKSSARKEAELDTLRAAREAQVRVGDAQAKDAGLDAEAKRKAQEARDKPDEGGRQADGTFKL